MMIQSLKNLYKTLLCLILAFMVSGCDFTTQTRARDLSNLDAEARNPIDPKAKLKVAILVPTGDRKFSGLSQSILDSADLAMHENKISNLELIPIDSTATNVEEQLRRNEIQLVLGPLFSNRTKEIYSYTKNLDIPVLTFSNDTSLANNKGLFLLGITPDEQVTDTMDYAFGKGYRNFFLVIPDNTYGKNIARAVRKQINSNVLDSFFYKDSRSDKNAEFKDIILKIKEKIEPEGKNAIIFPEGGENLLSFARALSMILDNQQDVRILGSSAWQGEKLKDSYALEGSWYPAINSRALAQFKVRFEATFGYKLEQVMMSMLGYDGVLIAAQLYSDIQNSNSKNLDYTRLLSGSYKSIAGDLNFNSDGSSDRVLVNTTFVNGQIKDLR